MIGGFLKVSYVDYPQEMASVIFLNGCNFKCPWCHNQDIVKGKHQLAEENVLKILEKNTHLVNHVVITGGEPTLYKEALVELIIKLKDMGFKVKLDTNGTNPHLLKKIMDQNLIDYVAVDIKNTWNKYEVTVGTNVDVKAIKETINILENGSVNYQFRTTCNDQMHTEDDIKEIRGYFNPKSEYKLQSYRYNKDQLINHNFGSVDFIKKD